MHTLRRCLINSTNFTKFRCFSGGIYEPSYLEGMKSKVPLHDSINIHLKGYDYPILENYQRLLHKLLKNIETDVEDSWALPPQHLHVHTYKPNSEIVQSEYKLKMYERIIQMTDVSTLQLPIILRAIETSLPAGVSVQVRPHEESDEENRYVPDKELDSLKEELEVLGGPSKKK